MLFETERHEALSGGPWDVDRVRRSIETIVRDCEARLDPNRFWPPHPLDLDGDDPAVPYKSLYLGAAGTLWAMWYLEQQGAVRLELTPAALIERVYEAYLERPDTGEAVPSYYLGEVGILLVLWRMLGSPAAADRLFDRIRANIRNPTLEALWAAPGTMLGALYMLEWTGEPRWRDLFLENADYLWETWQYHEEADCHLWTQDLYGHVVVLIGAGHGFAGNVYPLLRGASLLSAERQRTLLDRCVQTLRALARWEGAGVNWPQSIGTPRPGRTHLLVQWCHGAPGIVTGLTHVPIFASPPLEVFFLGAGELTWQAGPLVKGPGLCHGTAGNGYALLKVFRRTGDEEWLERARAFAMHAIGQSERMRAQHGQGRYSLWTGDPGLAVYLWHCMTGEDSFPGQDVL